MKKVKFPKIIIPILILIGVAFSYNFFSEPSSYDVTNNNSFSEPSSYDGFNKKVEDVDNIKYLDTSYQVPNVSTALLDDSGSVIDDVVFYMEDDEVFENFVNIGNFVDFERDYKLMTFIDYQKSQFYVDDILVDDLDITLGEYEAAQVPIKIPSLENGLHDVFFAIVKDPYADLSDDHRRMNEGTHIIYIRFNIIVGNDESFNQLDFVKGYSSDISPIVDIFLHKSPKELMQFPSIELSDKELDFFLTVGNPDGAPGSDKTKNYAVMLLKDWETFTAKEFGDIFLSVEPGGQITIPISTDIALDTKQEICAILIENPYSKRESRYNGIYNTIRLGVSS